MGLSLSRRLFGIRFIQRGERSLWMEYNTRLPGHNFHLLHLLAAYEGQLVSHSEIIQIITKEKRKVGDLNRIQ